MSYKLFSSGFYIKIAVNSFFCTGLVQNLSVAGGGRTFKGKVAYNKEHPVNLLLPSTTSIPICPNVFISLHRWQPMHGGMNDILMAGDGASWISGKQCRRGTLLWDVGFGEHLGQLQSALQDPNTSWLSGLAMCSERHFVGCASKPCRQKTSNHLMSLWHQSIDKWL